MKNFVDTPIEVQKPITELNLPLKSDLVTIAMKERYFRMMAREYIGKTPELTAEIDRMERAIRELELSKP